jgi:hypothetical protein
MAAERLGVNQQPTARSRRAALLLQPVLGVLALLRIAQMRPVADGVLTALIVVGMGVGIWWLVGKWFSLVVLVELGLVVLTVLGVNELAAMPLEVLVVVPAMLVGYVAKQMERSLSAPLADVDPMTLKLPAGLVDQFVTAGFRPEPDLAYRAGATAVTVAAFAHPRDPVLAEVTVRPVSRGGRQYVGLVSYFGTDAALETQNGATTPVGETRLRQVFPDAGPVELVERHFDAMGWLAAQGLTPAEVDTGSYSGRLDLSLDDTARCVRAHPLRNAGRAVILMARHRDLDVGPLQGQADIARRTEAVLRTLKQPADARGQARPEQSVEVRWDG